jgi:hypothetical protein
MRFNKIIRVWLIPLVADKSATPLPGADKGRRDKSAPTDGRMILFICIIAPHTGDGEGLRLSDICRAACALTLAGPLTLS